MMAGQQARQFVDLRFRQCERCGVSAIDPEIAGQLAEDLPREDFLRILRTFEADLRRLSLELEQAAGEGAMDSFRRAAHSLAGAAAALGARRLEQVARMAMERRLDHEPALLATRVRQEARSAMAELSALTQAPPG
jgi:HPt (histidine-containing phosphotransfer) domain-containing protein